MPQCQFPVFCCFCVSEKLHRKYSWNWTKQKPKFLFFPKRDGVQSWDGGDPGGGHATPWPRPRRGLVWAPGPPPDASLPPIYSPRRENLKSQINFYETYCKLPPSSTRDREGPEALPGTLLERGITAGGLLHHHACLRSDM
jgi:hypothetical protein